MLCGLSAHTADLHVSPSGNDGNSGIALAMVGAVMGYRVTILMSAGASVERRKLIQRLGAELILFDSAGRYQTGIEISREMAAKDSSYFLPRQFENPLNSVDHEETTRAGNHFAGGRPHRGVRAWLRHRRLAGGRRPGDQETLEG